MAFTRSGRVLLYNNNIVYLAGVLAGTGVGENAVSTTDALIPPFADDMQRLRANNRRNNFHRHWLVPYWNYSPRNAVDTNKVVFRKNPNGSWNLFAFNNAIYFTRLEQMIAKAAQQGIVVQLVLFDRCGLDTSLAREAPTLRWPDSPWNSRNNDNDVVAADVASGIPEFYQNRADIRSAQENYIKHVVSKTKNHWNVFYEIMNEPTGDLDARVLWADWVVGVIHSLTGGANMIFYNDHSAGPRGADVINWKDKALPNYNKFHGVIFHGRPADYLPGNAAYNKFRNDKIFQVSSDGFTDTTTENADSAKTNTAWTNHAFDRKMIYQAHSNQVDAAKGIGAATIKPTQLVDVPLN